MITNCINEQQTQLPTTMLCISTTETLMWALFSYIKMISRSWKIRQDLSLFAKSRSTTLSYFIATVSTKECRMLSKKAQDLNTIDRGLNPESSGQPCAFITDHFFNIYPRPWSFLDQESSLCDHNKKVKQCFSRYK